MRRRQTKGEVSRGRAQLDEMSIPLTRSLEKKPSPSLGFVDPNFDETRGGNVAMFIANVVRFALAPSQCLIVICQLGKPILWLDVFGLAHETSMSTRNLNYW